MESNFTAGIIIGIIIGVVGMKIFGPTENLSVSTTPQVQTRTIFVPSSGDYDDYVDYNDREHDEYDYAKYALHVRRF